jgi:DNA-binding NtrC family response regulator
MTIQPDHGRALSPDIGCAISSDVNVLISGGDHHARLALARLIHEAGTRRGGPFVALAPELSADQLTSTSTQLELVRTAAGGTLFIEEAAALSAETQVELWRLLGRCVETQGRSIRVIAATADTLSDRIASHRVHPDLFYRLNTVHVVLLGPEPSAASHVM